MTASALVTDKLIESYLNRLNAALAGIAPAERAEILREIQAHILDSTEHSADRDDAVGRVLHLLGTPEELAERYGTECLLTRASHSFSPWLLLQTSWRWAKLGFKGTLTFLLALFGYTTALSLTVAVFLKPFMPSKVGMWVGPEGLNIGVPSHPELMHELLGRWFIPVIALSAFLFAIGTTQALRWMIRTRTPKPAYPIPGTTVCRPVQS
jgi:uncharacterized membrane protein